MTAAYWIALAALVAALAFAWWVDYRAAEKLRVAREQRDEAVFESARQALMADAWRAIAEGKAAVAKVERGAL